MVVLHAARHRVPVPSLARWLLALGIAATLTRTWPRAGPTVWSGRWSRPGRRSVSWARTNFLVWLIRTCGAADRGPSAAHRCTGVACRAARRPVPASAVGGERPAGSERGTSGPAWRPAGQGAGQSPISASGQRDDEAPGASAGNDAAVAAYRLSVQAGNPLSERRLAPDVRAHIPPLGASQNRRCTASIAAPGLVGYPGHGLPVSRDRPPSPERDLTAPGRSGIGAWRSARSALCVNLDAMRVKGLAWLGIPAGGYAAGPVLRRDPGPGSCLRCGEHRGTYRRERRQDPAIRPRPPLLRVLPQPRRQHRPAARGGRPGSGEAELARGGAELLGERSQTAPGPGSPSGRPTGTSTAWASAWRSWQARRLWANALDMRQKRTLTPQRAGV